MNKNIKNALANLQYIRNEHPEMNKTELAIFLTGNFNSAFYKAIVLLLNEVK